MTIATALVLSVAAFAFIILPFFRRKVNPVAPVTDEKSQELLFKRDTVFSMLKELEFDHQSGILAEKDYHELEERYKKKGIAILKDIDSLEGAAEIDKAIEAEISQRRKGKAPSAEDEIEQKISSLRKKSPAGAPEEIEKKISERRQQQKGGQFCTKCGARRQPEDSFCAHCGAQLN